MATTGSRVRAYGPHRRTRGPNAFRNTNCPSGAPLATVPFSNGFPSNARKAFTPICGGHSAEGLSLSIRNLPTMTVSRRTSTITPDTSEAPTATMLNPTRDAAFVAECGVRTISRTYVPRPQARRDKRTVCLGRNRNRAERTLLLPPQHQNGLFRAKLMWVDDLTRDDAARFGIATPLVTEQDGHGQSAEEADG